MARHRLFGIVTQPSGQGARVPCGDDDWWCAFQPAAGPTLPVPPLLSFLLGGLLIVGVGSFLTARWIVGPLQTLSQTARALGAGDLKARTGLRRTEDVAPSALCAKASERFRARHPRRVISVEVLENLPSVRADPVLMRRAIDNVLENADKYSPDPDAPVVLRALPGRDGVEVCRAVRERLDVPIIMVTARTEEADRSTSTVPSAAQAGRRPAQAAPSQDGPRRRLRSDTGRTLSMLRTVSAGIAGLPRMLFP